MKQVCSLLFASTLTVLAAIDCAGAPPASAATLAGSRARCLSDDVSGDAAVTACTAAIRRNPKDAKLYVQRGVAWSQTGDYDYAIGDFSKAIRLDPGNALAFYNLGIAREKKGELQESLVDFKRYAELRPFDPDVRTAIERVTDALDVETAAPKTAPQTASAAIAEHFGDPLVAQVETTREPEAPKPTAANSAPDDFSLFLPALFMLAGATAVAMLIGKGGRRADARGHSDNIETEPVAASELGSDNEPDPPMAWCWSEFKGELDESSNRREPGP
ncbi:MAG: tetratricopeptide repeat protein [Methylocystis sp.]